MNSAPKTIICFGDSNTHGYNSSNHGRFTEKERWTCLLAEQLSSSYRVHEEGLSGRTTVFDDPLFEGLSGLSYLYPCLMSHEPVDLLIIMLGTNDVKARFSATSENIARGMERLVRKALDSTEAWRDGSPNVLIIAPPPIAEGYEAAEAAGEMGACCVEKSRALAPLYKDAAKRLNCHFLDAGSIDGLEMYPYDYMHLSLESHQLLADQLVHLIPKICR